MINVGSVWKKVGVWSGKKEGQVVIIENVDVEYVTYRYSGWDCLAHNKGMWTIDVFLERFKLIKDVKS